jgi:hypothetical protein
MKTAFWDSFNAEGVDVSVQKADNGVVFVLRYKTVTMEEVVGEFFDCPQINQGNARTWFLGKMTNMDAACHRCSEFPTCLGVLNTLRARVMKWIGIHYADFLDGGHGEDQWDDEQDTLLEGEPTAVADKTGPVRNLVSASRNGYL